MGPVIYSHDTQHGGAVERPPFRPCRMISSRGIPVVRRSYVRAIRAQSAPIHWCSVTGGLSFVSSSEKLSYDVRAVVLSRVVMVWWRLRPESTGSAGMRRKRSASIGRLRYTRWDSPLATMRGVEAPPARGASTLIDSRDTRQTGGVGASRMCITSHARHRRETRNLLRRLWGNLRMRALETSHNLSLKSGQARRRV